MCGHPNTAMCGPQWPSLPEQPVTDAEWALVEPMIRPPGTAAANAQ